MTAQTVYVNDWHRLADIIGKEHVTILSQTLPTPSLGFLLEAYARDCREQMTQLDLSREPNELYERYKSLRLREDFADSFLHFVKSIKFKPT